MPTNPLKLGRKMKPTMKHRPAVWEGILAAVYATDGQTVRYFDYDWDAAVAFAGVTPETDPRTAPWPGTHSLKGDRGGMAPRKGQKVLWTL